MTCFGEANLMFIRYLCIRFGNFGNLLPKFIKINPMQAIKIKGFILGFVAAATYGLNPLFALPLMSSGMDVSSVIFFRYLLAIPIVAVMMRMRHKSFKLYGGELFILALFGITMSLSSICLFESYRFMDAGIASTILFVYPIMVALIMGLLYHEKISITTIVCLATALLGIMLLYKGSDGATLSLVGTLLALGSALTYAIYIVGINKSRAARIPTLTVSFYVLVFGLIPLLMDLLAKGQVSVPHTVAQWAGEGALALLPTAISFVCTTVAIQYIGSTPTAILGAMEPLTAVVVGVTVFGEVLTSRDVTGLVLILVAVTLVIIGDNVGKALTHIRKLFPVYHHRH